MTTYNTGNPLGSAAAKDLFDNAQSLDFAINDITKLLWSDRFGRERKTWYGIQKQAEQAMLAFGYVTMDSFEDGATLTLPNQVLRLESNGEYYRWDGSFPKPVSAGSTPESTGGIGSGAWLSVGDATLRSNLASTLQGLGASLIGTEEGSTVQGELNAFKSNESGKGAALIGVYGGSNLQDIFVDAGASGLASIGSTLIDKSLSYDENGALWILGDSSPTAFRSDGYSQIAGTFEGIKIITVGNSVADFASLTSAITFASKFKPKYVTATEFSQNRIEINILTGYIVTEQVIARQIDLSHITLTSDDTTVKVNVPTTLWWMYGEFGAHLPIIATIFDMQGIGYDGLALKMGAQAVIEYGHGRNGKPDSQYAGIINAANHNVFANTGSRFVGRESVFTGAKQAGVHFEKGCSGCLRDSKISGNGVYGIRMINMSIVDAYGVDVSGVTAGYGMLAEVGSSISSFGAKFDGCKVGIRASGGSRVVAPSSTFSGMGTTDPWANSTDASEINIYGSTGSGGASACLSNSGSKINMSAVDASAAGSASGQMRCLNGSTLIGTGTTGTFNKAVNTVDANGIIFK